VGVGGGAWPQRGINCSGAAEAAAVIRQLVCPDPVLLTFAHLCPKMQHQASAAGKVAGSRTRC